MVHAFTVASCAVKCVLSEMGFVLMNGFVQIQINGFEWLCTNEWLCKNEWFCTNTN